MIHTLYLFTTFEYLFCSNSFFYMRVVTFLSHKGIGQWTGLQTMYFHCNTWHKRWCEDKHHAWTYLFTSMRISCMLDQLAFPDFIKFLSRYESEPVTSSEILQLLIITYIQFKHNKPLPQRVLSDIVILLCFQFSAVCWLHLKWSWYAYQYPHHTTVFQNARYLHLKSVKYLTNNKDLLCHTIFTYKKTWLCIHTVTVINPPPIKFNHFTHVTHVMWSDYN